MFILRSFTFACSMIGIYGTLIFPALNFTGLAALNGLQAEKYKVVTDDGYILTLFRIPGSKNRPILLVHGLIDCAESWILRGPTSLLLHLVQAGYDVWLPNLRGSQYSREHLVLNSDLDIRFWDYSFHEMGYYDLPAIIDFVLKKNGVQSVAAIGHSQGNQVFYVMCSTKPEYNKKVEILISLAPISFLRNVRGATRTLISLAPVLGYYTNLLHLVKILDDRGILRQTEQRFCSLEGIGYDVCAKDLIFAMTGSDPEAIESEFFTKVFVQHYPRSTSIKNILHLSQLSNNKAFAQFSYSPLQNYIVYGAYNPPKYNLKKVTIKVALLTGQHDTLATVEDTLLLSKILPNIVKNSNVTRKEWGHLDFLFARNMSEFLFPFIDEVLTKYYGV